MGSGFRAQKRCFNPTLVRLRHVVALIISVLNALFQSHAGSIEALDGFFIAPMVVTFQSHAGSIEARETALRYLERTGSFNPTLVRLRPERAGPHIDEHVMFQSHAGSIEAHGERDEDAPRRRGFNPTLVRLRHGMFPAYVPLKQEVSIPRWLD